MQSLASFYVFLVTLANTVAPSVNLPKVLGVETTATPSSQLRQAGRAELKARLGVVRDEKKKKVVENLDERIAQRQQKWCEHGRKITSQLDNILTKIKTRREKVAANGKDVSAVNIAISEAEFAVAEAKAAAEGQCGKTYAFSITDEKNLGQDVKTVVQQFSADTKAVMEAVKSAREALRKAHQALQAIKGVDEVEAVREGAKNEQ